MQRMTDAEIIEVVKARMEGKAIQCRYSNVSEEWQDERHIEVSGWDFSEFVYRVKPREPRVPYVIFLQG